LSATDPVAVVALLKGVRELRPRPPVRL